MKRPLSNPSILFRAAGAMLLAGGLGLAGAAIAAEKPKAPLQRLASPEKATAAARVALDSRMARHGNTMSNLVKAVVLLDRPTVSTLALRIADEEVVARSAGSEEEKVRKLWPKSFLAEQDKLRNAARDLAKAAVDREADTDLADRFATLARTCVTCHSVYLAWGAGRLP